MAPGNQLAGPTAFPTTEGNRPAPTVVPIHPQQTEMEMRFFHTAMLGASVAVPVAILGAIIPAHAQSNGVLGQAQRFLNGNQDQNQNAYEQGRQDQMQQDQTRRQQQWQGNNPYTQNQYSQDYQPRYGQYQQQTPQPYNNNGYSNSYNTGTNNNGGYSNGYNNSYNGTNGNSR